MFQLKNHAEEVQVLFLNKQCLKKTLQAPSDANNIHQNSGQPMYVGM